MKHKKDDIRISAVVLNEFSQESQARILEEFKNDDELQAEMENLRHLSDELHQHFKSENKQRLSKLRLARIEKTMHKSSFVWMNRKEYYAFAAVFLAALVYLVMHLTTKISDKERKDVSQQLALKKPKGPNVTQVSAQSQAENGSPYQMQDHKVAAQDKANADPSLPPSTLKPVPNGVNNPNVGLGVGKILGVAGTGAAFKTDFRSEPKLGGGLGSFSGTGIGRNFSRSSSAEGNFRNTLPPAGYLDNDSGGETYAMIKENAFIATKDDPRSTFSVDVDSASYANVRRFIEQGQRPPLDAIRIEELINYFRYEYPTPKDGQPFAVSMDAFSAPWNPEHRLVRIGIKGQDMKWDHRPALNLVFLVDVSGSMASSAKLDLVKSSLKLVVDKMSSKDRIALVTYAGNSGVALAPTSGENKAAIVEAIDRMSPGGGTNGSGGIEMAYSLAQANFQAGAVNRVVLATDGDFNLGQVREGDLTRLIQNKAAGGVQLTVLGFGMGNTNDKTMELLANKGNGNYAYIDSILEAKKALVREIGATMITIAQDVKLQLEFNPKNVGSYRLIGYENRLLAHQDFNDDKKDAGDIGAGHTVTAFYEIIPAGKEEKGVVDALKYATLQLTNDAADELLTLKLRYKQPGGKESKLISSVLKDQGKEFKDAPRDFKFAAAVAMFGMELRNSPHKGKSSFEEVLNIAGPNVGGDDYRRDFLELVKRASSGISPEVSGSYYGTATYKRHQVPTVQFSDTVVKAGLSVEVVENITKANLNQLRHCYDQFLQRGSHVNGSIEVNYTISPDGRVSGAAINNDTVADSVLAGCITSRHIRWKFPKPQGGQQTHVSIKYSFIP